jgi:hypothetical protein
VTASPDVVLAASLSRALRAAAGRALSDSQTAESDFLQFFFVVISLFANASLRGLGPSFPHSRPLSPKHSKPTTTEPTMSAATSTTIDYSAGVHKDMGGATADVVTMGAWRK